MYLRFCEPMHKSLFAKGRAAATTRQATRWMRITTESRSLLAAAARFRTVDSQLREDFVDVRLLRRSVLAFEHQPGRWIVPLRAVLNDGRILDVFAVAVP